MEPLDRLSFVLFSDPTNLILLYMMTKCGRQRLQLESENLNFSLDFSRFGNWVSHVISLLHKVVVIIKSKKQDAGLYAHKLVILLIGKNRVFTLSEL